MKLNKTLCIIAMMTSVFARSVALADVGHNGPKADAKVSPEMQKQHDEMEAKMADTSAFGLKADPKKATRTIKIEASEIKFDMKEMQIKTGETVKFVVTNKGEQAHEFTVGDAKYQEAARAMMAMMAEMSMDPASPGHQKLHAAAGNTAIVLPGQTKEIAWTFSKPGDFEFSCNMVGHSESGMKGTIKVS